MGEHRQGGLSRPCHLYRDGADDGPRYVGCKVGVVQPKSTVSNLGLEGWTQEGPNFSVPVQPVQPVQLI